MGERLAEKISDLRISVDWFWQGISCRFGHHHGVDIVEEDASVKTGFCLRCSNDTAPKNPRPPDPQMAAELAAIRSHLDDYLSGDDFWDGRDE